MFSIWSLLMMSRTKSVSPVLTFINADKMKSTDIQKETCKHHQHNSNTSIDLK